MMKLVMVDPSKSKNDKIRSTTFHHFKRDCQNKQEERQCVSKKSMPIIFHKFNHDSGESMTKIRDQEVESNRQQGDQQGDQEDKLNFENNDINNIKLLNNNNSKTYQNTTNENPLVFKMDSKYNNSNSEIISSSKRLTGINHNRFKKLTFVKSCKNDSKVDRITNTSGNISDLDDQLKKKLPNLLSSSLSEDILQDHYNGKRKLQGLNRSDKCPPLNINEVDLLEFQAAIVDKSSGLGRFSSDTEVKLNRVQPQPPVIKGYSTYTFKVNLKDNEKEI